MIFEAHLFRSVDNDHFGFKFFTHGKNQFSTETQWSVFLGDDDPFPALAHNA